MSSANLPKHIAIIPDGNRRWAKRNAFAALLGHRKGADTLVELVSCCLKLGIEAVTFYGLSAENMKRSPYEVKAVLGIIEEYCLLQREKMVEQGIRFSTIGAMEELPEQLQKAAEETRKKTAGGKAMNLTIALNYGGRQEICRTFSRLLQDAQAGLVDPSHIDEAAIASRLDSHQLPDVDLLIRTSGEQRVSNYLPWQLAYAELYFSDLYWPDFNSEELTKAVSWFAKRNRRYGE